MTIYHGSFIFARIPNGNWGVLHVGIEESILRYVHMIRIMKRDGTMVEAELRDHIGTKVEDCGSEGKFQGALYRAWIGGPSTNMQPMIVTYNTRLRQYTESHRQPVKATPWVDPATPGYNHTEQVDFDDLFETEADESDDVEYEEVDLPGYHLRVIKKGTLGELSKIREELEELEDAHAQGVRIMELVELSDLIGAIDAYVAKYHPGTTIDDLVAMHKVTKRAFENGRRA